MKIVRNKHALPPVDLAAKPPEGLSAAAATWWAALMDEYAIDDLAGRFLLEQAMRAFDRMGAAAALVAKHGECAPDRFGQLRANPACVIERDARTAMLAAFKLLNLSVEPLHAGPGRPRGR